MYHDVTIFRQYYIALHAFSPNIGMMSPKSRKQDQKMKKEFSVFFQFSFMAALSHWHQDWVTAALAYFETC